MEAPLRTEVVHADEGLVLAVRGALVVGIWSGLPTYERHAIAFRVLRETARAVGHPVAVMSISPEGAPVPSPPEFAALARDAAAATPSILAMAIVFDGHGPWAERAFDLMSRLDEIRVAIRPDSFARKFTTSVEEGASWLAAQLRRVGDIEIDRSAILEAVEHSRAHVP